MIEAETVSPQRLRPNDSLKVCKTNDHIMAKVWGCRFISRDASLLGWVDESRVTGKEGWRNFRLVHWSRETALHMKLTCVFKSRHGCSLVLVKKEATQDQKRESGFNWPSIPQINLEEPANFATALFPCGLTPWQTL